MHRKLMMLSIPTAFVLLGVVNDAQTPAPAQSAAPSGSVGMIINIDPATGAIVEQAAPSTTKLAVPAEMAQRWSTSDEGLVEEPNPSGNEGVYVNLQGRFQNGMIATVDANGTLRTPCAQGLNAAAGTTPSDGR